MKHQKSTSFVAGRSGRADRGTFMGTVRLLLPYIWPADRADLRLRVLLAIVLMVASKLFTIATPYAFKWVTDALASKNLGASAPVVRVLAGGRGPHGHLWAFARRHVVDATGPGRAVRIGRDERRAKVGDRGFRSFAPAFAALSSRAQDRRTDEGSRARTQRDRNHYSHFDANRCSDAGRIRLRHSGSVLFIRLAIRRGHSDYGSGVSGVHYDRHQLAHIDPTFDERKRQRR